LGGILPPFALALAALLPRLVLARGASEAERGIGPLGSLGLGLGVLLGSVFLLGGFEALAQPVSVVQKVAWVAAAAGAAGAVEISLGARGPVNLVPRGLLRLLVPAAALSWYLAFLIERPGAGLSAWITVLGSAIAIALLGLALDFLAALRPGPGLPIAWTAAVAIGALTLLFAGSASLAQTQGALAACLGALALAAGVRRRLSARGAGVPVSLALGALLAGGAFAAELPLLCAVLLGLALLAPGLVELLPLRRSRPLLADGLRVALALAPALAALALAYEPGEASAYG
jgi:hypothetical protein